MQMLIWDLFEELVQAPSVQASQIPEDPKLLKFRAGCVVQDG